MAAFRHRQASRYFLVFFLGALLLWGCGPKQVPLSGPVRQQAEQALHKVRARKCPLRLDGDLTLRWRFLTRKSTLRAMVQLASPDRIRLTIADPLGRPGFILVSSDEEFRAVVVPEGKAYVGSTNSQIREQYLPLALRSKDLFAWLGGGLPAGRMHLHGIFTQENMAGIWYELSFEGDENRVRHKILLDTDRSVIRQHLLIGENGEQLCGVTYSDFRPLGECLWPFALTLQSNGPTGEITLRYTRLNPVADFPEQTFQLNFPPSFTVERVE